VRRRSANQYFKLSSTTPVVSIVSESSGEYCASGSSLVNQLLIDAHIARRRERVAINPASGSASHPPSEDLWAVALRLILRSVHVALPAHLDPSSHS
jgi:hypothetical protein